MAEADCALMDEAALSQWILRRLGGGVLKVELCQAHVDDAIADGKRWFTAKKGAKEILFIEAQPSVVEYELPDRVDTIIDVSFMQAKMDLSLIFSPFTLLEEKIPYDVFASGGSGGLYSSYVQSMQYIEMAKRILSAELEWRQERTNEKNLLYIAPPPARTMQMAIEAKCSCFNIQQLSERDHDLIKRYSFAFAMRDLGEMRSKFSEYPGAQGSTNLNGDALLQRSTELMEKLEVEIFASAGPMGFLTG